MSYRAGRGLVRGILRRCPACGEKDVFRSWIRTRIACPRCGILMNRGEEDFFLGGYTLNFIVAELVLAVFLALTVFLTWPEVPWRALMWVGAALMVLTPLAFFPFSRTIWLALDLAMRPPREEDFDTGPSPDRRVS